MFTLFFFKSTFTESNGVFSGNVLLYTTICGCILAVVTGMLVVGYLCCRRRDNPELASPNRDKKGYQKGKNHFLNVLSHIYVVFLLFKRGVWLRLVQAVSGKTSIFQFGSAKLKYDCSIFHRLLLTYNCTVIIMSVS